MGAYRSSPIREKTSAEENVGWITYGSSSMQGWRVTQEDAHSCCPHFDKETALFAVYDGHGGHEVAQYAAMKYPDFLKQLASTEKKPYVELLQKSFIDFDDLLTQKEVVEELKSIAGTEVEEGEEPEEDEAAALCEEATMPLEQLLERYQGHGKAKDMLSPVVASKRDKLLPGDTEGESRSSGDYSGSGDQSGAGDQADADPQVKLNFDKLLNGHSDNENNENIEREIRVRQQQQGGGSDEDDASAGSSQQQSSSSSSAEPEPGSSFKKIQECGLARLMDDDLQDDDDSESEESYDSDEDMGDAEEGGWKPTHRAKADNEDGDEDEEDDGEEDDSDDGEEEEDDEDQHDRMFFMQRGDIVSGCTAVVALLMGKELHVANAGDSRCVVSRAGKAVDMSIDHKPDDEPEKSRIIKAGGQVTDDGRVNGGLNLSRALGDHIYKQNKSLPPEEQMITALPDVKSLALSDDDEFMVLACDGIWNVMTSQDAVNFVSDKLKSGMTSLSQICEEMFEYCLAPSTEGDGSGCDNMTAIIVLFKPYPAASGDAGCESGKRRASNGELGITFGEMSKKLKSQEDSSNESSNS